MIDNVKEKVLEYIRTHKGTSYAELENYFEKIGHDFRKGGEVASCSDVNPNVYFWSGWDIETFMMLTELVSSGEIEREPCHPIVYLVDGYVMHLPLVRSLCDYKTPHWLPCVFVIKQRGSREDSKKLDLSSREARGKSERKPKRSESEAREIYC